MELERPVREPLAARPEIVPQPRIEVLPGPTTDVVARAGSALVMAAGRIRSSGALDGERMRTLAPLPDGLERFGRYLERRQMVGLRSDAEHAIVARPLVVLLAVATLGYAAARAVRR